MIVLLLLTSCGDAAWTREAAVAPTLAVLDRDRDGRVTEAEYTRVAWAAPPFAQVDTDGSGSIDVGELRALVDASDPREFHGGHVGGRARVGRPRRGGPGGGPGPGGEGMGERRGGPGGPGGEGMGERPRGPGGPGGPGGGAGFGERRGGPGGPGGGPDGGGGLPGDPGRRPMRGGALPPGVLPVEPREPEVRPDAYYVLLALREEVVSADSAVPCPVLDDLKRVGLTGSLTSPEARALLEQLARASAAAHVDFPTELLAPPAAASPAAASSAAGSPGAASPARR